MAIIRKRARNAGNGVGLNRTGAGVGFCEGARARGRGEVTPREVVGATQGNGTSAGAKRV